MFRSLGSALAACVLLLLSPGGGSASPAGTRIVVGYTAEGYSGARALEREFGAEVIGRIGALRADVLRLGGGEPDGVLALLRADPRVRYAELDEVVRALRVPNDEFLPRQWSVTKTHAEQAWDLSTGSSQVVVGILDTGIDPAQPDLRGKLVAGYDYVNNDQDPSDDNGHGTAVAGIVAADSDNGIGVAGYCWACRLMPVKVLGADGTGFVSGLAQGIVWAADHGARVINASLGSPVDDLTLTSAVQYAWLRGVPVVAEAGGSGTGAGATRTKVVTGRLRQGRNVSVVLATGAGLLRATAKARTGRATIRLRLLAAGRVAASARGAGRASLRAQVRARTYRLVVSTTSRKPLAFALTISYPAASS